MSQTITPVQPSAVIPPPGRNQVNWIAQGVRGAFAGTPGRLRLIAIGVIAGCLIAGFGGAWVLQQRSAALGEAKDTAAHLVQLQQVQTELLQADAAITNSFLQGGLEPPQQLSTYFASVDSAADVLAQAARASSADARALGQANTALTQYTGLIQAARANNRLGKPVGVNYLSTASDTLRTGVLGPVQRRADDDQGSVDRHISQAQNARWWLLLAVLAGIGVLLLSQFQLAQATRRIINLPAAVGAAVLLVVLVASAAAMAAVQNTANQVRDGAYADTVKLASARVGAFTAKSVEAFELIRPGSGTTANEKKWSDGVTAAARLPASAKDALTSLNAYRAAHAQIRAKDNGGDFGGAVDLATLLTKDSANGQFGSYDQLTARALATSAQQASDGLNSNGWLLLVCAVLLVLAGVAAALLGWFGVSLRLGEYR